MKGTVKFYNQAKGFGFITAEDGKEYFFHQNAIKGADALQKNEEVTFDVEQGDRGPRAANVSKAS